MSDFLQYLIHMDPARMAALFITTFIQMGAILAGLSAGRKYSIKRYYSPTDIKKVILPPALKQDFSKEKINPYENKKVIVNFVKTLENKLPKSYLDNMYYNLSYLKVNKNKSILLSGAAGIYYSGTNIIKIAEKDSLNHELFHMASTSVDKRFCGLSQKTEDGWIGKGLNEGYTELLTRRYFPNDKKEVKKKKNKKESPKAYDTHVSICRKLEKIVGKEKMTEFYLTSNLSGLIKELKKYSTNEEISKFIANVDLMHNYANEYTMFGVSEIKKAVKEITSYLIKTHLRFLQIQINEGRLTEKESYKQHKEFVESIEDYYRFFFHKYKSYDIKDIYKIYDELSEEKNIKR